jgi:hypothetical protein
MEKRDVEMEDADAVHPLQLQLEEAEETIASLSPTSDPAPATKALQEIIAYSEQPVETVASILTRERLT